MPAQPAQITNAIIISHAVLQARAGALLRQMHAKAVIARLCIAAEIQDLKAKQALIQNARINAANTGIAHQLTYAPAIPVWVHAKEAATAIPKNGKIREAAALKEKTMCSANGTKYPRRGNTTQVHAAARITDANCSQ